MPQKAHYEEYIRPKRWEGKPWSFRIKYLFANYPEMGIAGFFFMTVIPLVVAIRCYNSEGGRYDALKKYKLNYTVVRDDHPNIEKIKAEKELGREYFPKY